MLERKFITYSRKFKKMTVRRYLGDGKSYKAVIEELDIKDTKTLRSWIGKYQQDESLDEQRGRKIGSQQGHFKTALHLSKKSLLM